ncbi:MAG TPA: hypothetical protein VHF51_12000, partial [Solirubrobacteraceae bacterium]|jgi:hypothetical protein|nr:hypothetical protein [Solirubrobacteraceae bacterium]
VLVLCAPAAGAVPIGYVSARVRARAVAALRPSGALAAGEPLVLACADGAFLAQVGRLLRAAGLDVRCTTDVTAAARAVDLTARSRPNGRSRAA